MVYEGDSNSRSTGINFAMEKMLFLFPLAVTGAFKKP
jgi:hypothetical protein